MRVNFLFKVLFPWKNPNSHPWAEKGGMLGLAALPCLLRLPICRWELGLSRDRRVGPEGSFWPTVGGGFPMTLPYL